MTDALRLWRKALRVELLAQREAVAPERRREWNEAITAFLLEEFAHLEGKVVACYWPIRGEFDPRFAIRRLRERGARAALPVMVQKNAPLQFREWWPGVEMAPTGGAFNLPVPVGTPEVVPDALLIPPVGFDAHGYRLGYGGGYFDRTLAAMARMPLRIGVAFELSRIPTIHPQPHDIPMEYVVTQAGVHRVGAAGLEAPASEARKAGT